jgi:hypothetical protein
MRGKGNVDKGGIAGGTALKITGQWNAPRKRPRQAVNGIENVDQRHLIELSIPKWVYGPDIPIRV